MNVLVLFFISTFYFLLGTTGGRPPPDHANPANFHDPKSVLFWDRFLADFRLLFTSKII